MMQNGINESFWDGLGVEIGPCAIFKEFPEFHKKYGKSGIPPKSASPDFLCRLLQVPTSKNPPKVTVFHRFSDRPDLDFVDLASQILYVDSPARSFIGLLTVPRRAQPPLRLVGARPRHVAVLAQTA